MKSINKASIKSAFEDFYPLSLFNDEDIDSIISNSRFREMKKSGLVFKPGSNDPYIIFLLAGSIELHAKSGESFILTDSSELAKYPVANIKPRRYRAAIYSEKAVLAFIPVSVFKPILEKFGSKACIEENAIVFEDDSKILDSDWMMALLQTPMFSNLPTNLIEQLFQTMEEVHVKAGDEIIRQDDFGGYFYLIKKGECAVTKQHGKKEETLKKLFPTQGFGEEALLLNSRRSANVRMLTDGVLLKISNNNFTHFLSRNLIHWIEADGVEPILNEGAIKLYLTEKPESKISGAIRVEPGYIRNVINMLSKNKSYLILSDNEKDAVFASYLLSIRGTKGYIFKGRPEELLESDEDKNTDS